MSRDDAERFSEEMIGVRLFTRGVSPREDYQWRVQVSQEPFDNRQADLVFHQLLSCQTQETRQWALWRELDHVHLLLFHLPSMRHDHVRRPIMIHLHLVWRSNPLKFDLTTLAWLKLLSGSSIHQLQELSEWGRLIELIDELAQNALSTQSSLDEEAVLRSVSRQLRALLSEGEPKCAKQTSTSGDELAALNRKRPEGPDHYGAQISLIPIQPVSLDKLLPEMCEVMLRFDRCGVLSCDYLITPSFSAFARENRIYWRAYVFAHLNESQEERVIWPPVSSRDARLHLSNRLKHYWDKFKQLF